MLLQISKKFASFYKIKYIDKIKTIDKRIQEKKMTTNIVFCFVRKNIKEVFFLGGGGCFLFVCVFFVVHFNFCFILIMNELISSIWILILWIWSIVVLLHRNGFYALKSLFMMHNILLMHEFVYLILWMVHIFDTLWKVNKD